MDDWNSLEALDAEISVADFLFTAKCRPVLHHVRTRVDTRRPHFTLFDYPRAGQIAELLGAGEVRITDGDGRIVARGRTPVRPSGGSGGNSSGMTWISSISPVMPPGTT